MRGLLYQLPVLVVVVLVSFIPNLLWAQPEAPTGLTAKGYDSHVELRWDPSFAPNLFTYRIYRSEDGGANFEFVKSVGADEGICIDFVGRRDADLVYRITVINFSGQESDFSGTASASTRAFTDEELLTMVQEYTFRYFWDFAHPVSGLARERNTTATVTSGGSGFGVMAILVGIERGFITRKEGLDRLLKIATFLQEDADRFMGVWPHWMNGATGEVIPFSRLDNGGDLVETSFLIQGLLAVRQYFDGETPEEIELRERITQMWEEVDWNWHRNGGQNVLWWHWSPEFGFELNLQMRGYYESLITYLLAVASPTKGIPANVYHDGWAGLDRYTNGNKYFGYTIYVGPPSGGPLFWAHYSYIGFDPRFIKDPYANYFIHNINHTLVNRAYCIANPGGYEGYGENCWGLTSSDDPLVGYQAHEPRRDNGTIAPTAALSSMPYTPQESMGPLRHFYRELGDRLWGKYGFYDAFNLTENWFANSYLAIDQGPIICMIENYRSELLWDLFMANPEIPVALDKIGFETDSTVVTTTQANPGKQPLSVQVFPNPLGADEVLFIELRQVTALQAQLYTLDGRQLDEWRLTKGLNHQIRLNRESLHAGVYLLRLQTNYSTYTHKVLIAK